MVLPSNLADDASLEEMQLDGYENQGRAIMWFLNLAICFYTMDAWAKASFTLKKSK